MARKAPKLARKARIACEKWREHFKYNIDFIVHSTTKFLNGHGTAIGGVLLGKDIELMKTKITKVHRLLGGNSNPFGSDNFTSSPFSFRKVSVSGLKAIVPAIASAVTTSGDATNACVLANPSFLFAKFLLYDVRIVFFLFGSSICLAH